MKVTTFRASNPGSTRWIWAKLRTINPAPIRSTSDSATSRTTSTLRSLLPRTPPVSASPVAQRVRQVAADRSQRRREPEHDRGDARRRRGVQERREVDGRPFDTRQVAGTQRRDEADALPRQEHAEHGARPESTALSTSICAMMRPRPLPTRGPHRDLASTLGRPDQQQVRDVGARDQQHEPDGAKEGEQSGPRVAHDITVHPVRP